MIVAMVAFLQAVSTPPDIELRATVRARSLTIEKQGDARVSVTGNGRNGRGDASGGGVRKGGNSICGPVLSMVPATSLGED